MNVRRVFIFLLFSFLATGLVLFFLKNRYGPSLSSVAAVVDGSPENGRLFERDNTLGVVGFLYGSAALRFPESFYNGCQGRNFFCLKWPELKGEVKYGDDASLVLVEFPNSYELRESFYPASFYANIPLYGDLGARTKSETYPGFRRYASKRMPGTIFYLIPSDKNTETPRGLPFVVMCSSLLNSNKMQPVIWVSYHKAPVCLTSISFDNGLSLRATFYDSQLRHGPAFLHEWSALMASYVKDK